MLCLYFICERNFYARKNYATLEINTWGGLPLSRNFHVYTHKNYSRVSKIEVLCERTRVKFTCKRKRKLRDSGNLHIGWISTVAYYKFSRRYAQNFMRVSI